MAHASTNLACSNTMRSRNYYKQGFTQNKNGMAMQMSIGSFKHAIQPTLLTTSRLDILSCSNCLAMYRLSAVARFFSMVSSCMHAAFAVSCNRDYVRQQSTKQKTTQTRANARMHARMHGAHTHAQHTHTHTHTHTQRATYHWFQHIRNVR